jgi:hypothetical protein
MVDIMNLIGIVIHAAMLINPNKSNLHVRQFLLWGQVQPAVRAEPVKVVCSRQYLSTQQTSHTLIHHKRLYVLVIALMKPHS